MLVAIQLLQNIYPNNAFHSHMSIKRELSYKRGYNNTMKIYDVPRNIEFPDWIGDDRFHKSHRMNLLRKDYKHYSRFFKNDVSGDYENYPYYWATSQLTSRI